MLQASALSSWHRSNLYCPACGAPLQNYEFGRRRICFRTESHSNKRPIKAYPRTVRAQTWPWRFHIRIYIYIFSSTTPSPLLFIYLLLLLSLLFVVAAAAAAIAGPCGNHAHPVCGLHARFTDQVPHPAHMDMLRRLHRTR